MTASYRARSAVSLAAAAFGLVHCNWVQAGCKAESGIVYLGTQLFVDSRSHTYIYAVSRMAVDADGAPNAYRPDDKGLDFLKNAGYPNGWHDVLVPDPVNGTRPYVQQEGPYAGYFVSKTRLEDRSRKDVDPARYVDATAVPYLVFPGEYLAQKGTGRMGDVGIAYNLNNGKRAPFVVADQGGPQDDLGEVSVALAERLGGSHVNPRNGNGVPHGKFAYILFPNRRPTLKWPISTEDLENAVKRELQRAGLDEESLLGCVR